MDEKQYRMWDALCGMEGETVAQLFTGYYGLQLLNDGFCEYLQDEGYMEPDDEDEDEDEEIPNCENGEIDCDTCSESGNCDKQIALEHDDFNKFCMANHYCDTCPLRGNPDVDCEEELWPELRRRLGYGNETKQ